MTPKNQMTIIHITEYYTQILRNKYSFYQHMKQFPKLITYYGKKANHNTCENVFYVKKLDISFNKNYRKYIIS